MLNRTYSNRLSCARVEKALPVLALFIACAFLLSGCVRPTIVGKWKGVGYSFRRDTTLDQPLFGDNLQAVDSITIRKFYDTLSKPLNKQDVKTSFINYDSPLLFKGNAWLFIKN